MNNQIITYDNKGFIINGKREFLIGGEFHYFRVPHELWEDRLQKMKRIGANLISVYIPWNIHEPEEGKERWSGDYNLEKFLGLCEKYDLYILIKPGPYVCAELDFGGHPDWLIAKIVNKEIRLRMLDAGYLKLCRRWYKKVSRIINPHLVVNGGKIVAVQIENEYDHLIDYGGESITRQDAINYFLYLKKIMEECKIDVPKFANEAMFLRGKDIIDTRTYYPNIPGLWMWEFDLFDDKIIGSKKEQPDCPIMILELQAGWFAQIGAPIYEPQIEVVEGVSKSVLIQGASVMNYYMMVGGTTFPFMGARGDIYFLGGLGNITSYDFGSSPIREGGKIDKNKFYWIKGFIRFTKEFADVVLESDKKSYVKVISGGEDIVLLKEKEAVLDVTLENSNENFAVYEEGGSRGRFLFIRNLEDDNKTVTLNISKDLIGKEYTFKTTVRAKETKLIPITFKVPGTGIVINYSTSEVLLSKKYEKRVVFVMYGKSGTEGEMCINKNPGKVTVVSGNIQVRKKGVNSLVRYNHSDLNILKIENMYLLIIEQEMMGRVEELSTGLLFHNTYYIQEINEKPDEIKLDIQVIENSNNVIKIFNMAENKKINAIYLNGDEIKFMFDKKLNMYTTNFNLKSFVNKPWVQWTSDWKYIADSAEISDGYDCSSWLRLDKPISLEEAGLIEHGYYWYRAQFNLEDIPSVLLMNYEHNDTDRMFIYINGVLIYKSYNKKIKHKNITDVARPGKNTVAILYANEFHNKSHPHEGDIIKFSGIINPIEICGKYADDKELKISLTSFYVKKGLSGINKGYHTLEYNDDLWNSIPDVKKFVVERQLGHIIWFRRKFRYNYGKLFIAPLMLRVKEADQKLTIYVNGNAIGRYDSLGPQKKFYIPESFLNSDKDNVLSIILECPGFYDELQSGYKRGYMYNLVLDPDYIAKKVCMKILLK